MRRGGLPGVGGAGGGSRTVNFSTWSSSQSAVILNQNLLAFSTGFTYIKHECSCVFRRRGWRRAGFILDAGFGAISFMPKSNHSCFDKEAVLSCFFLSVARSRLLAAIFLELPPFPIIPATCRGTPCLVCLVSWYAPRATFPSNSGNAACPLGKVR